MKTRPILFSAPMVRAGLDGSKTQTRRVVSPANSFGGSYPVKWCDLEAAWPDGIGTLKYLHAPITHAPAGYDRSCVNRIFPRIAPATDWDQEPDADYEPPASRLWVRETWAVRKRWDEYPPRDLDAPYVWYKATHAGDMHITDLGIRGRWRPSIHMPRELSRITLEVTEVRVERLQEISEEDALAEGVFELVPRANRAEGPTGAALALAASAAVAGMDRMSRRGFLATALAAALGFVAGDKPWDVASGSRLLRAPTAREVFQILWDSINAKRAPWDSNPWVWVVSFKRVEQ